MVFSHQVRYKTRLCTSLRLCLLASTVSFLFGGCLFFFFFQVKRLRILSEVGDNRRSRPYSTIKWHTEGLCKSIVKLVEYETSAWNSAGWIWELNGANPFMIFDFYNFMLIWTLFGLFHRTRQSRNFADKSKLRCLAGLLEQAFTQNAVTELICLKSWNHWQDWDCTVWTRD